MLSHTLTKSVAAEAAPTRAEGVWPLWERLQSRMLSHTLTKSIAAEATPTGAEDVRPLWERLQSQMLSHALTKSIAREARLGHRAHKLASSLS
jgi:hypothetical protein